MDFRARPLPSRGVHSLKEMLATCFIMFSSPLHLAQMIVTHVVLFVLHIRCCIEVVILRLGVWSIVLTVGYMPYSTASTLRGGGGLWALVWEEVMGTSLGGGYGH